MIWAGGFLHCVDGNGDRLGGRLFAYLGVWEGGIFALAAGWRSEIYSLE